MAEQASRASRVLVSGPLAPFVAGFELKLGEAGYAPGSAVTQVRLLAHLSRWLSTNHLEVIDLTDRRIDEFFEARRARNCTWCVSLEALEPLLALLSELNVLPASEPLPAGSAADVVLAKFRRYLLDERGLAATTACAYVYRARRFVDGCRLGAQLAATTTGDVTRAVLMESATLSIGATQFFVAALRSFLRFCSMEGLIAADLSAAALPVTGRRPSSLPRGISSRDANALLNSCDRGENVGRRDYAMIVMLLRLGLRATEVATLKLDDLDWRAAEVVVHGKGRRDGRLPLPVDVGEAIAAWLQHGRPKTTNREVFLSVHAPIMALGRGGVGSIVRCACVRAGVPQVGPHRLRHTMATEMVNSGVPLAEISQVLRHRSLSSTAIYARVDLEGLRRIARPWPGGSDS
jgi:integrase/recombinase XerD